MAVHKCPVCNGRGTVPPGFYDDGTTTDVRQTCRACGGKGVIIVPEPSIYPSCKPARRPIYPPWGPSPTPRPFPIPGPEVWWGQGPWYA